MFRSHSVVLRELVYSLLKSLILKFVRNVKKKKKVSVVVRQHNIWCVYVRSVWRSMPDCMQSCIPLQTERTYTHQMLCCRITTLTF